MKIFKHVFLILISFLFIISNINAIGAVTKNNERELNKLITKKLTFINIDNYNDQHKLDDVEEKIVIRKTIQPDNKIKKNILFPDSHEIAPLGEVIWEINRDMLPITTDICLKADVDICGDEPGCHNHCVQYGVQFIAYDEQQEKLYMLADTLQVGQGGGPFLGFVANLKNKKISYLKPFSGFADGYLSPSGKYLLIAGKSYIQIYDTETNTQIDIPSENIWTKGHERLHYISDIKWLSDSRFSYHDGVKHSKFQANSDEMKENIYDISAKKIIQSRVINQSEHSKS